MPLNTVLNTSLSHTDTINIDDRQLTERGDAQKPEQSYLPEHKTRSARGDHVHTPKALRQTGALWFWQRLMTAFRGKEHMLDETIDDPALAELVERMPPLERFPSARNGDSSRLGNKGSRFPASVGGAEPETEHNNRVEQMASIADQADLDSWESKPTSQNTRVRKIMHPDFMRRLAIFGHYLQHQDPDHDDSRDNDYLFAIEMYILQVWHYQKATFRTKLRAD
jgi:hypothetical protein